MPDDLSELRKLTMDNDEPGPPPPSRNRTGVFAAMGIMFALALAATAVFYLVQILRKPTVKVGAISRASAGETTGVKLVAVGYVQPQRRAVVGVTQRVRIAKLLVQEGQEVAEGAVIAALESSDLAVAVTEERAALRTAKARVRGANASLSEARMQQQHEQTLFKVGSSGQAAVDTASSRVRVANAAREAAQAEVQSAEARLERAQLALKNTDVLAPISGRILKRFSSVGEMVSPNGLVEIVDFNSLVVEADVAESKIGILKVGDPAEIALDAFAKKKFRGEISDIQPSVDRQKAAIAVRVKFLDPTTSVLPQMAANVSFLSKPIDPSKVVQTSKIIAPRGGVVYRTGRPVVYVFNEGTVRLATVVLGESTAEGTELREGPPVGTKIVIDPPESLSDGATVSEGGEQ